jgi:hypothetical protein
MSTTTMTKREATETARKARRYGYFAVGTLGLQGYVRCPVCRKDVHGYRDILPGGMGKRLSMARALDAGMVEHLLDGCETGGDLRA